MFLGKTKKPDHKFNLLMNSNDLTICFYIYKDLTLIFLAPHFPASIFSPNPFFLYFLFLVAFSFRVHPLTGFRLRFKAGLRTASFMKVNKSASEKELSVLF